jgi:glutamate racemase
MAQRASQPIGIFDSGIGGLTVAQALSKHLPKEALMYVGDTAHFPYGDKSVDSIKYYAVRIADFLLDKGCKAIVIACNTASAMAYEAVKKQVKGAVPVFSVIDPVVEEVCRLHRGQRIGVIGTKGTIKADAYSKKIKQLAPECEVTSLATPLLAPMIEEGFFNNTISRTIIHSYLSRPKLKKIDALILACTHYPLIKDEIASFYPPEVTVLDSADVVARAVAASLKKQGLLATRRLGSNHFYVTDFTKSFERSTAIFYRDNLKLEPLPLWENE